MHAHRRRSSSAADPFSKPVSKPWLASGDRHLGSSSDTDDVLLVSLRELVLSKFLLTPLAIRRQPEPRQWLPGATRQLAICAPELRSLFCGFWQRPQFGSDTTGPMHCPSERAKSATPTESCRRVLVRCPLWRALSLAVCCRSRRVRQ